MGPLTAADDYDFEDTTDFGVDGAGGVDETSLDVSDSPYGVDISGATADLSPVYNRAIERLRSQRSGLTSRERIGALLVGFGQPTRHGKWQEGLANGANLLFQQSIAQKQADAKRRAELERLTNARDIAGIRSKAQIEAARIRAAKGGGASDELAAIVGRKPNADEILRYNYAKSQYPDAKGDELKTRMYGSVVTSMIARPGIAGQAAASGHDVAGAVHSAEEAFTPTLQEFLLGAREDNPGVADADLVKYYKKTYGGRF